MRHMEVPMILKRLGLALALITGAALLGALLVFPASAQGLTKGSTVLSFQLAHGDGDFVTPEAGTGFITAYDHSEWGGQAQVQHLISENWALAVSFGLGTFKETNEPGSAAPPATTDFEYSQSSWNVRLGFDRVAHITPEFHLYAGPGIQVWSGKAKFDDGTNPEIESESTSRLALSGRLGAFVSLSESIGLNGHLGGYIGRASADDAGAEASWTPSGHHGALGIGFQF
jgi:hypothetical protein